VIRDPAALVGVLRQHGFDASRATSAIAVVPAPSGQPDLKPVAAAWMMEHIAFLPCYPGLSDRAVRRLVEALRAARPAAAGASPLGWLGDLHAARVSL
jgi:dTDP-4-amino-4,6-dideoxygalactose transaminase